MNFIDLFFVQNSNLIRYLFKTIQQGKSDCTTLGRVLKEKYGSYFRRGPKDLIGFSDKSPYSIETVHSILTSLFGWSSSFVSSGDYKDLVS